MKTLDVSSPSGKLTQRAMHAAVEAKLREVQDRTSNLLWNIDPAWDGIADQMRAEAAEPKAVEVAEKPAKETAAPVEEAAVEVPAEPRELLVVAAPSRAEAKF